MQKVAAVLGGKSGGGGRSQGGGAAADADAVAAAERAMQELLVCSATCGCCLIVLSITLSDCRVTGVRHQVRHLRCVC